MISSLTSPRWWDLRSAFLLLVALFAVASRLTATRWTEHLQISFVVALAGLAAGLALGQSRFRLLTVLSLAFGYGVFIIGWQIALTLGSGIEWMERVTSVGGRLVVAAIQFATQKPVADPLLALILFAILFWVLSLQAGYALTRHADPWQATLPGGLALLVIHTYDYRPPGAQFNTLLWALSVYFVMSLLLLARMNYLKRRAQWTARRVHFSPEADTDILQATFLATIALVVLAWTAPLTPNVLPPARDMWTIVSRPWHAVRSRFGNMFTSLRASFGVVDDYYTDRMSLGRGNALSDDVVLEVEASARPPGNARYYWRAWSYDRYEDGRWASSFTDTESATPDGFDFVFPEYQSRWAGVFAITPQVPIGTLYTPQSPVWVSRPISATLGVDDEGFADLASVQAVVTVFAGETYRVHGSVSTATITELRGAGSNYPQWIKDHYLQVPAVSDRVHSLARQIAAPYGNAYDIADAVTNYLRDNIEYQDVIDAPPPDREPIDWFLFDYRRGFCNYYATAEIILLRSLGIPARMSAGYARGQTTETVDEIGPTFGDEDGPATYVIRQRDAHAWPEVYFPDYGWVEFEPTVSQAPISRQLGAAGENSNSEGTPTPAAPEAAQEEEPEPEPTSAAAGQSDNRASLLVILVWLAIPAAILALGFAGWKVRQRVSLPPLPVVMEKSLRRFGLTPPKALAEWARIESLPPVAKAYQEINFALSRLGSPPEAADTPADRAAHLKRVLPQAAAYATKLLAEYHAAAYSQREANVMIAEQAGRLIRNLSWREFVNQKVNGVRPEAAARTARWGY